MDNLERLMRDVAKVLAPYIAEELGLSTEGPGFEEPTAAYDNATCSTYVAGLGDTVLENAESFFRVLAGNGEVGSLKLAEIVGVERPTILPFVLTTPLKRRAKSLGLPRPWTEDASPDHRTIWRDCDGIANRMVAAIENEKDRRAARAA
jgi:hypothetical protein